ncbi:hypothetical protein SGPA1_11043 [Streptomyces misionensis JCM 4497]
MGQAGLAVRAGERQVPFPAHPFADLGLVADRAGRVQQRHPHLCGGDGGDPGPHPVAAHQRPGRGARPAHRLLGAHRPQHPAAHPAGVGHHPGHRPVGRQRLCGASDVRPRAQGLGAHPGGGAGGRHGAGHRRRHPQAARGGGGGPHPGPYRLRAPAGDRRQQVPGRQRRADRGAQGRQLLGARPADREAAQAARGARRAGLPGRPGRAHPGRRGQREPAGAGGAGGPRQGDGRGDLRRPGEGVRPAREPDPYDLRCVPQRSRRVPVGGPHPGPGGRLRGGRGAPAAHPGRQDGPGRPRPRPEGDRDRLRRPGLRRRRRPAVPDPGRGRPAGGRGGCARGRRVLAGRRSPHPRAGAAREAGGGGPRGHHDRGGRGDPAAGRADAAGDGRHGRVPARDGDPGRGPRPGAATRGRPRPRAVGPRWPRSTSTRM